MNASALRPRDSESCRTGEVGQAGVWSVEKLHLPHARFRLRGHFNVLYGRAEGPVFAIAIVFTRCDREEAHRKVLSYESSEHNDEKFHCWGIVLASLRLV
jgi:hypothetical protein